MKKDIKIRIQSAETLANGCVLMQVSPADGSALPEIAPGQFVNIKVPATDGVFLRRPISVCDVEDNLLTLYIKPVGKGTDRLCSLSAGDEFEVLLPLGSSFSCPSGNGLNLLIGGGVGIAPLLYLARKLREAGQEVAFLLGGASASDLELAKVFGRYGEVHLTTVDGSAGTRGFVTDHAILGGKIARIYSCGPTPMMKAVAKIAKERAIDMEASLENHMACGLGACLCCVEDTTTGNRCVCTDGPVFNISELKW